MGRRAGIGVVVEFCTQLFGEHTLWTPWIFGHGHARGQSSADAEVLTFDELPNIVKFIVDGNGN